MRGWKTGWRGGSNNMFVPLIVFHSSTSYWRKSVFVIYKSFSRTYWLIPPLANTWLSGPEVRILTRAGTRLFKNRRLIEYLKEATRSARLGTRSVLGAAGKFEIWIIFDIKQSKKCQHKTSTFAFLFLFNPPNITKPSICRESSGVEACPVWDHLGPLQVQVHHVAKIKWKVEKLDDVSGQVIL